MSLPLIRQNALLSGGSLLGNCSRIVGAMAARRAISTSQRITGKAFRTMDNIVLPRELYLKMPESDPKLPRFYYDATKPTKSSQVAHYTPLFRSAMPALTPRVMMKTTITPSEQIRALSTNSKPEAFRSAISKRLEDLAPQLEAICKAQEMEAKQRLAENKVKDEADKYALPRSAKLETREPTALESFDSPSPAIEAYLKTQQKQTSSQGTLNTPASNFSTLEVPPSFRWSDKSGSMIAAESLNHELKMNNILDQLNSIRANQAVMAEKMVPNATEAVADDSRPLEPKSPPAHGLPQVNDILVELSALRSLQTSMAEKLKKTPETSMPEKVEKTTDTSMPEKVEKTSDTATHSRKHELCHNVRVTTNEDNASNFFDSSIMLAGKALILAMSLLGLWMHTKNKIHDLWTEHREIIHSLQMAEKRKEQELVEEGKEKDQARMMDMIRHVRDMNMVLKLKGMNLQMAGDH